MIDKELRKLNRLELLEMLVEQSKQIDELQQRLDTAEKKLADRDLKLKEAGTLAEAALKLNDVFEAADAAGKQYVDALKRLYDEEVNRSMKETVIPDENR
jgi:CRISPR/Cas system CSM-associated protein Csm2 small subunit